MVANEQASYEQISPYRVALQLFSFDVAVQRSEIEDDAQCRINAAHLVEAEEPDAFAEPARVDRRGLLGKHPGVHAADFNLGTKAGGTSRRGRWRDQPCRQRQLV
jgi:hypothetical protein